MKVIIAGGTGFIGKALIRRLTGGGHSVFILSRRTSAGASAPDSRIHRVKWNGETVGGWASHFSEADAVINLAGEPIAGRRWSEKQKEKIILSRIVPTKALVKAIEQASPRPGLLINASAVGYYGNVSEGEVSESDPPGKGFLADTCMKWEQEAAKASDLGVRVVPVRIGIVLSEAGGALPRLMMPFRFYAGGYLGSGFQWMPWIHIDDLVEIIFFILTRYELYGPFNAVSPEPVTMKEFAKVLGKVIGRPSWMPVPSFMLKLMLGEMSGMLLEGQKAIPRKLNDNGFSFKFKRLEDALADLLKR